MRTPLLILLLSSTPVLADPDIRQNGASARLIGCTPWVLSSCDGATSIRMGLNIVDLGWFGDDGTGPLLSLHQASRPEGGLVLSHTIAALALRRRVGPGWLQGGPALAVEGVGTRTIKSSRLLDTDARPAMVLGAGIELRLWQRPIILGLDLSSSYDSDIYQITASASTYRF